MTDPSKLRASAELLIDVQAKTADILLEPWGDTPDIKVVRVILDSYGTALNQLKNATYVGYETQAWIAWDGNCWHCHQTQCYDEVNMVCKNCGIYRHMEWRQNYYEEGDETLYYRTIPFSNPYEEIPDFKFPETSVMEPCPCGSGKPFLHCHGAET